MTQRSRLKTLGYNSSKKNGDGSFLGEGKSKVVWRQHGFAVMNATDEQREITDQNANTIEKSNYYLKKEYNFTVYLHQTLTAVKDPIVYIPKVYLYKDPSPFGDHKFRYAKELCEKVTVNDVLFDKMIELSQRLLAKGWFYLDMKPDNLGMFKDKLCIVDTDYRSFYRVPIEDSNILGFYLNWSYILILIYSRIFLRSKVTEPKLIECIQKYKINENLLKKLWETQVDESVQGEKRFDKAKEIAEYIADYGNHKFEELKLEKFIQLDKGDILCPYLFFSNMDKLKLNLILNLKILHFLLRRLEI
jgi:hypothetical protein